MGDVNVVDGADQSAGATDAPANPTSLLGILFSFRGRIDRSAFWLKGVLVTILLSIFVSFAVLVGGSLIVGGSLLAGLSVGGYSLESLLARSKNPGTFLQSREGVKGSVSADTGPADVQIQLTAKNTTKTIKKTVIVGGRRLEVTATRQPEGPTYDMNYQWRDKLAAVATAIEQQKKAKASEPPPRGLKDKILSLVNWTVTVLLAWPWFAIAAKRLHDRGQSGWLGVIGVLPILGNLYIIIVCGFLGGDDGDNRFGPDPAIA